MRNKFFSLLSIATMTLGTLFSSYPLVEGAREEENLNLCTDAKLGYKMKCNPDWGLETRTGAVKMIVVEEKGLHVSVTIGKSREHDIGFKDLTRSALREIGNYADLFTIEETKIAGLEAVKVTGNPAASAQTQLLDYYVIKDGYLYTILFTVEPKEKFSNYETLFKKLVESFELLPTATEERKNSNPIMINP